MSRFNDEYEQLIVDVIDILEYNLSIKSSINKMRVHYAKHDLKEDSNIKQYVEMLTEKERELYILLIQLKAYSEIFKIRFQSVANAIAKEENISQNWLEDLAPYIKKVEILLGLDTLQPQV
jgi:hypothetical protein